MIYYGYYVKIFKEGTIIYEKKIIAVVVIVIFSVFASILVGYGIHSASLNKQKILEEKVMSDKSSMGERDKQEKIIMIKSAGIKAQILAEKNKQEKERADKEKILAQQKIDELAKLQQEEKQKAIELASQNTKASSTTSKVASQPVIANANSSLVVAGQTINTGSSSQIMVVYASEYGVVLSTAETYEKVNNLWRRVSQFVVNVGVHGFASPGAKREGDGKSPSGNYDFGSMMFGQAADPGVNHNYNYKQVCDQDYWVDDSSSSYYNQYKSGAGGFNSAEHLNIHSYLYAAVIGYNQGKIPGLGSAIFFHLWSGAGSGTAGCISTDQSDLVNTLKWLNPSANPHIIMGVKGNLQ